MKRSIWVVMVLFILSAGILCVTTVGVDMRKDDVTIEETTLHGDKAALEGLHLELNANAEDLLFWNIQYKPETGEIDTEFRFGPQYAKNASYRGIQHGIWFGLYPYTVTSMSSNVDNSSRITQFAQLYETEGFDDVVEQIVTGVAARTKNGETHAEYVYLKDYCEVYPLRVEISLPVGLGDSKSGIDPYVSFMQECREYFQIPVHEDYRLEFSVRKDEKGRIQEISLSDDMYQTQSYIDVENFSLATEYGVFFAFQGRPGSSISLDTSMIQGEYGICYIPYVDNEGQRWAYFEDMRVIRELSKQKYLEQMALSKDGSKVYLLMQDADILEFVMIDAETAEIIQVIPLMSRKNGDIVDLTYEYDNFIAVNISGDSPRTLVIEKTEENRYEHVMTAQATDVIEKGVSVYRSYYGFNNELEWSDDLTNMTMAWDGERLAVAAFTEAYYYFPCSFHLAVYDRSGLLYCGKHINSLDVLRNSEMRGTSDLCRPDEVDTWSLSWK